VNRTDATVLNEVCRQRLLGLWPVVWVRDRNGGVKDGRTAEVRAVVWSGAGTVVVRWCARGGFFWPASFLHSPYWDLQVL
jgi:hypothetical protein